MSNKEKPFCENCSKELSEDEIHELDGLVLCSYCSSEESDLKDVEEGFI